MFSLEYFCPNYQRLSSFLKKILKVGGEGCVPPPPPRSVRLCAPLVIQFELNQNQSYFTGAALGVSYMYLLGELFCLVYWIVCVLGIIGQIDYFDLGFTTRTELKTDLNFIMSRNHYGVKFSCPSCGFCQF